MVGRTVSSASTTTMRTSLSTDVMLPAHHRAPVLQLAGELDAGEACAGHDEGQVFGALLRVRLGGRPPVHVLHVPADRSASSNDQSVKANSLIPGMPKNSGSPPGADHEVVIGVLGVVGHELPRLEIDGADTVDDPVHPRAAENLLEADLYALGLDPAARDLVQLGHQGVDTGCCRRA